MKDLTLDLQHKAVADGRETLQGCLGRSAKAKLLLFLPLLCNKRMLRKILKPPLENGPVLVLHCACKWLLISGFLCEQKAGIQIMASVCSFLCIC